MSPEQFLAFIEQPNFLRQVRAWGKKNAGVDLKEKARLFQDYLRQGLSEPDYVVCNPQGEGGGDWAHSLKITLVTRLGYSETEALNLPLSQALADYYRLAENDGVIQLLDLKDSTAAAANAAALERMTPCPA